MSAATQVRVKRPPGRWRRRWYRLVIPFTVLALLIGVTLVARSLEDPDLDDPQTLAPSGTGPDGSSQLAGLLAERGVTVEPVDTLDQAQAALRTGGDAVLFVPKPTLFGAWLVSLAARRPGDHRVVLVAPGQFHLQLTGLPVAYTGQRWASRATTPSCPVPQARAAGVATALRNRYAVEDPAGSCYRGGLVRTRVGGSEVFVVGASDPFRNRRIGEHGNARLAVELLAARDRVVWAGALSTEGDLPELSRPGRGELDRTPGNAFEGLLAGYPPGVLAGLLLAVLLAVLVAAARARRLGPPVSEPLPVLVPAAETVVGRGRLYQRTRGRGVALAALRAAALPRLTRALGLPAAPPPEPETIVQAAARRSGLPADHVRRTLYGPEPATDGDLTNAVAALDALVATVTRDNPATEGGPP